MQDKDEISPCEVREPPQVYLSPITKAADTDMITTNEDGQACDQQHGQMARRRSPSLHSLVNPDRETAMDTIENGANKLEQVADQEKIHQSAPNSSAASQCSEEEVEVETAIVRRMSRYPVKPQVSVSSHDLSDSHRASVYYFMPSKRSSSKSSLNDQHVKQGKRYSSFSYEEGQPELINTFAPSSSFHSSRPLTATNPPRLDLNLSVRSSFQSLFAVLPSPLRTPSTHTLSNGRRKPSIRATLHHPSKNNLEATPHMRFSYRSSRPVSHSTATHTASRPTSSASKRSYYRPTGMPDALEEGVEYFQKLVSERQAKDSNMTFSDKNTTRLEAPSVSNSTSPSRVRRRDGERPFFGSGIYERVSKARKVWMEKEKGIGNICEEGARSKPELPQRGRSHKSPRSPSAVGDWGKDIFQEIDKTMLETVGDVEDEKQSISEDVMAGEESDSEAEDHDGDVSRSVETRDMI